MRELQSKQRLKRRLYSTPSLVILAIFTFLLVRGAYGVYIKEEQSAQDVTALQAKTTDLTAQQAKLNDDIERLNTSNGVDEEIKSKYNVSEEGEHVAVLVDQTNNASDTATTTSRWYSKLWSDILSFI